MPLRIGDEAPDFSAETTGGKINFHEWIGDGWAILFSHPKDFTPVCTTELGYLAGLKPEFDKRNCKILGLSIDSVEDHNGWMKDIVDAAKPVAARRQKFPYRTAPTGARCRNARARRTPPRGHVRSAG